MTPNRSAGRIEDDLWAAFRAECKRRGISNTDGMRDMIYTWTGKPKPAPLGDAGSAQDQLDRSLAG